VEVDLELLKKNTKYGSDNSKKQWNENTPAIKWFWEVLEDCTHEDKLKFIKFCWGQERLPANYQEFERT
jgi:hypothetical protein